MIDQVEIIVVNYNTPDLINKLLMSRDICGYSKVLVRVVDGSDTPEMISAIQEVASLYKNVHLVNLGYNIHHGPGLTYGIKMNLMLSKTRKYVLTMDSDSQFAKEGAIEHMMSFMKDGVYMVGGVCFINEFGIGEANRSDRFPVAYCHPSRCLLNRQYFQLFKPPIKHGAPFIETMFDIHKKGKESILVHIPDLNDWIPTDGRGTVTRYGYNL